MLKRLLTQKKYFKHLYKEQKGITGLETAIILIAFVVVAAVFAYTVLSAGLFSTQKSQEAVYSGLEETQSTMNLKGAVVAVGGAELDNCDHVGWVAADIVNVALSRETTDKWEGSGSLKVVTSGGEIDTGDEVVNHTMDNITAAAGDTIVFWAKFAATNSNFYFAVHSTNDLSAATDKVQITAADTAWHRYSLDLTGDITEAYYGIYCSADNQDVTFYLDNVMFTDIASHNGDSLMLDNCNYVGWIAGTANMTLARDTSATEGAGDVAATVAAGASAGDVIAYHAMTAKALATGDTVTFWAKASDAAALDNNIKFHIATAVTIVASSTEEVGLGDLSTSWKKVTMTLTGATADNTAIYFGFELDADCAGTLYIDDIQINNANLNTLNDPMLTFARQITFTASLASADGEGIDFTTTTDTGDDGIFNSETKTHKVVVDYNDGSQQVSDLAWSKSSIGYDDGDNILESTEKFQITVDLTYVNQHCGLWPSNKVDAMHTFTLEVKPPKGAVLTIERTMPVKVLSVNDLH